MGRGTILLLLPLLLPAAAQEIVLAIFHQATDPETMQRGWILDWDEEGFTFQRFGSSRQEPVKWADLMPKDRAALRRKCRLDGANKPGTVEGVRIRFKGGATADGVLERIDDAGRHWVRNRGLLLPYPEDRIDRVEKITVQAKDVYSKHQLYVRQLARSRPRDAEGHRTLADFAFDVGEFRKAKEHYQNAVRLRPDWRPVLTARLAEIEDLLKDAVIERELGIVKRAMRLDRDYARAERRLNKLLEANPTRRSLLRAQDQLKSEKRVWLSKRFHAVKNQEFKRAVEEYLRRKSPTIDAAMAWARSKLVGSVRARVIRRMRLTEEEFRAFSETRPKYSPHYANYWSGTFVISRRAKKGSWSRRRIRGDPNRWWFTYNNVGTRGNFLRAYAAERNPKLFEVISVKLTACEKCDGSGRIKQVSLRGLNALSGGHEWFQTCPRCYGARNDRVVVYR